MRKLLAITLATTVATATGANALQTPQPDHNCPIAPSEQAGCDPHVRIAVYHENESVLLVSAVGRSMTIKFGDDETIALINFETPPNVGGKNVPAPWQTIAEDQLKDHPLTNAFPVWDMQEGRSSLQIVTSAPGRPLRTYFFQLAGLPKQPDSCGRDDCDDPHIMTGVRFVYPDDIRRSAGVKQVIDRKAMQEQAAAARLKTDCFYGTQNWKYIIKGKQAAIDDLAPDGLSDNTQCTAFVYYGRREIPAIYTVPADGHPRQITPSPGDNGAFFIYESNSHWRLIKGTTEVVDIFRKGPETSGENPFTGTTSPEVVRVIKTSTN